MGNGKNLLDRLRADGSSWAQPLFDEAADRIEDLERRLADANGHVAALTAALTTRRSACHEESERADRAEQRAWEIIGYLGEVDVNQLDPDGGDAATFERALAQITDLERQLAEARAEIEQLKRNDLAYNGIRKCVGAWRAERDDVLRLTTERDGERWMRETAERQLEEARATLTRIARGTEAQARVMRDPIRTGGWTGAERVADAFDDIADRARTTLQGWSRERV